MKWSGELPSLSRKNRVASTQITRNEGRWSGDGIDTLTLVEPQRAIRRSGSSSHGTACPRHTQRRDAFV
eukprot:3426665-Pleurochrysis_carterae.AAC.1